MCHATYQYVITIIRVCAKLRIPQRQQYVQITQTFLRFCEKTENRPSFRALLSLSVLAVVRALASNIRSYHMLINKSNASK